MMMLSRLFSGSRLWGVLPLVVILSVAGCSSESLLNPFGANKEKLLPGKRLAVISDRARLQVDPQIAAIAYTPPAPTMPQTWTQPYGNSRREGGNLAATGSLASFWQEAWRVDIGRGISSDIPLQSTPIAAGNRVFVMDTDYHVRALDLTTGEAIWDHQITSETPYTISYGGGISLGQGRVVVTTGYGDVLALDALSGEELWRQELRVPIRAAATIIGHLAIVQTLDSQALAFDLKDGSEVWYNAGITEITSVINQTSASGDEQRVFLAFNSGEITAVTFADGEPLWNEVLASGLRTSEISRINTIGASPVLLGNRLLISGYSNQMVMFNAETGRQLWRQQIGSLSVPWVAADVTFVLGNDRRLYALDTDTGGVRWLENPNQLLGLELARQNNPDQSLAELGRADVPRLFWTPPVMIAGKIITISNEGDVLGLSPQDGRVLDWQKLRDGTLAPPIMVNNYLMILTPDGQLVAYR